MKVKDLMSTNIVCVSESATASQIAGQMRKSNIGSLPVCDQNNHIKGIITDRDLALRVLTRYEAKRNAATKKDTAGKNKKNGNGEHTAARSERNGQNNRKRENATASHGTNDSNKQSNCANRHNEKSIIPNASGEITFKNAAEMTAAEIMTTNPVVVSPNANIHDAALLFAAHKVRRLPVTEASKVVGMLSLGDIAVKPIYIDEAGDALSAISLADGLQSGN